MQNEIGRKLVSISKKAQADLAFLLMYWEERGAPKTRGNVVGKAISMEAARIKKLVANKKEIK